MKFKFTKGNLAAASLGALWLMAVMIFLLDKEQGKAVFLSVAPLLIDAMKWISLAFLGLNVIDNGVQGKWYNEGLANKAAAEAGKEQ